MNCKRKLILLITLLFLTTPKFSYSKEYKTSFSKGESMDYRNNNGTKASCYTIEIFGSGMGSVNGMQMAKDAILDYINDVSDSVIETIKNLFSSGKSGIARIEYGRYIGFTPCTHCPWPSIGIKIN